MISWAYIRTAQSRVIQRWTDFVNPDKEADALSTEDVPGEDELCPVLVRFDRMGDRLVARSMLG